MVIQPRWYLGAIVMIFNNTDGPGEWAQARIFAAEFNRYNKRWEYEACFQLFDIDGEQVNGLQEYHWVTFTEEQLKGTIGAMDFIVLEDVEPIDAIKLDPSLTTPKHTPLHSNPARSCNCFDDQ